jgi:trehalose 6-phosphate phosphatase
MTRMEPQAGISAVLFDLDGVLTDTATVHAAAWQRLFDEYLRARAKRGGEDFRPFDTRHDYYQYVDGKPRSSGVQSFLASRGIELPYGDEDDPPDRETICGLGNRKDGYFNAWLSEHQAQPYPGTLRLIRELRDAGLRLAMFSASRNATAVLANAGILDLFDARVDGEDRARLDLPGKPDPATLLEAARQLGVAPADAAVIEDSIAGVRAGVAGNFGVVVGVNRGAYGAELEAAGAHLLVQDLSELRFVAGEGLVVKTLANLPSAWDREDELRRRVAGKRLAVFLDYDGTLSPIVEDHTRALLSAEMRAAIERLAGQCPVTIISGRDLAHLRALVGLDTVFYAGSHGFEVIGPAGSGEQSERGAEFLPALDQAERDLRALLQHIEGHSVERKKYSIAVHYRRVAAEDVDELKATVEKLLSERRRLRMGLGKKVLEVRPDLDWDKGRAVLWILQRLGLDREDAVPLYVGDDITDEDAFHVLADGGLCVAVRHDETRPTAADYAVQDTQEVQRLLAWLAELAEGASAPRGAGR